MLLDSFAENASGLLFHPHPILQKVSLGERLEKQTFSRSVKNGLCTLYVDEYTRKILPRMYSLLRVDLLRPTLAHSSRKLEQISN